MRYTKQLQADVKKEIANGMSAQDCAKKHGIPLSVVVKWNDLKVPVQRANEIAVRKYQTEVLDTETAIDRCVVGIIRPDISDESYLKTCENISKKLFELVSKVVSKERELNPHIEKFDSDVIDEITQKWANNQFIKRYKELI